MADELAPQHQAYQEAVLARLRSWLEEKRPGEPLVCSVCNAKAWEIGDPGEIPIRGPYMAGKAYPTLVLVCKNCGHSLLFNAIVMGVPDAQQWAAENQPEKSPPVASEGQQ